MPRCKECGRTDIPDGSAWCCWCGKKIVKSRTKKSELKIPEPRQLKSGNWNIQLRIDGRSISITEETERTCREKARAVKAGLIEADRKPKKVTIEECIQKFIDSKSNVLSPSTRRGYMSIKDNRFKGYMQQDVYNLTEKDYQRMINEETALCAPKTVKNAWALVADAVKYETGVKYEVDLPTVYPDPIVFLDHEQILKFCRAVKDTKYEIPFLLGLSGLRRSEILGLRWSSVDLEKKTIHVEGAMVYDENHKKVFKTTNKNVSSNRYVPIMIPQLYDAMVAVEDKSGLVVTLTPTPLKKALKKVCAENNLPDVTIHGLRHSFASLAEHLGIPIERTMRIGGWSNDKTLKRIYTHIYDTDIQRSQNEITEFFLANDVQNANEIANAI